MSDTEDSYSNSESYTSSSDTESLCNDEINNIENLNDNDIEYENVIGIDLGTSNSCVAIYRNGMVEIIPDEYGHKIIPSYVAFGNSGNRYVGHAAKNQTEINPKNVFYEVKRLIGRKINDNIIENEKEYRTYNLGEDQRGSIILISNITNKNSETGLLELKKFTPEEVISAILVKLKNMASEYLKSPVTKAVITIPANFNDGQRQATKDAAKIAGLECIRLVNEPTAAGIAYGMTLRTEKTSDGKSIKRTALVYDFGGGTLDVTLLIIENGKYEVIASSGNMRFGGSDFDTRLIQYCIGRFERINHFPKLNNISPLSMQKLKRECEDAKKKLSNFAKTYIFVPKFYNHIDLCISLKRIDMEKLFTDLFLICLKPVEDILKECELDESKIDDIILVGGMTRMPKIRNLIKSKFGKEPICNINPDEAIAAGAAIDAYIACHRRDPFTKNLRIQDVVSLSLGVETIGGIMDVIISRGDSLPCSSKKRYSTDTDYTDSVTIKIYEGERSLTRDNFFVGEFELTGIEKVPRGIPEIEVTFHVDENGIISVSAENLKTNDFEEIIVTSNKNRLSDTEINRLIEESKELEFKDMEEKKKKYCYYEIEDLCSNILVNILPSEHSKLSCNDRDKITTDINNILSWLKEKKFDEREDNEFEDVIKRIRERYGVLMLKGNIQENNINEQEEKQDNGTTVYGNEEETNQINEAHDKMAEEIVDHIGLDDPDKQELEDIKESIINLCYEINEIIIGNNLNMSQEHITELKNYIDDSLLWIHTHNDPIKEEFLNKMNEINDTCNKFMDVYSDNNDAFIKNPIIVSNINKRIELENLCVTIKLLISKKEFPMNDKESHNNLINKIDESLKFIYIQENEKSNSKNFNDNEYYNTCDKYIDSINNLCNEIYNSITGINFENNIIPQEEIKESNIILSGPVVEDTTKMGTSIFSIKKEMQKNILEDMINKDDSDNEEEIKN
jgi:molecular chaperone DnaK (HSP70)